MNSWLLSVVRSCMVFRMGVCVIVYVVVRCIEMDLCIVVIFMVSMGCLPRSGHIWVHVLVLGSEHVAVIVLCFKTVITVVVWIDHLVVGNVVVIVVDWSFVASLVPVLSVVVISWVQSLVKIMNWGFNGVLRISWDWLC